MKIAIIGAGVIGATTAYVLAAAGHEIDIVEQANRAGEGVSAGNAGQLAHAYVDPLAGPEVWRSLPGILSRRDPSTRIAFAFDRDFLEWGARFLWQCRALPSRRALEDLLTLSRESREAMQELLADAALSFSYRKAGKIILYRDHRALEGARQAVETKRAHGFALDLLDGAQCRRLEPALEQYPFPIAGGVYSPDDALGDCGEFSRAILRLAADRHGARLHLETRALGLIGSKARVKGVTTDKGDFAADAVVLSAGPQSGAMTAPLGLRLPLQPVIGYSVTAPLGDCAPSISLTDRAARLVIARIGDNVRIAAHADLEPRRQVSDPDRAADLLASARRLYPRAARWDAAQPVWMGRRPMTPDGRPITGACAVPGLFLNIGHGGLGWTLAMGSAARLARVIGPA